MRTLAVSSTADSGRSVFAFRLHARLRQHVTLAYAHACRACDHTAGAAAS